MKLYFVVTTNGEKIEVSELFLNAQDAIEVQRKCVLAYMGDCPDLVFKAKGHTVKVEQISTGKIFLTSILFERDVQ